MSGPVRFTADNNFCKVRDLTPIEPRKARYHWIVEGEPDFYTVLVMEDSHRYWRVVRLITGEAIMTGFSHSHHARDWAKANRYKVIQPC